MDTYIPSPTTSLNTVTSITNNVTNHPIVSINSMDVVTSDLLQCKNEQFCCKWSECIAVFQSLEQLVSHVSDLHVKAGVDDTYRCHWQGCPRNGRGFNARYKVLVHVRTHTNEKPHACYFCGKHFSRLESLKIHKRTHTGEKPYVCPYEGCSKAYSNSSDRFKHALTHRIDRPYGCKMPGCTKRYTDPSSLRKHMRAYGHHLITNAKKSDKEKTVSMLPPRVTTSTEVNGSKLPGCIVSSVIQDGQCSFAKVPQLPFPDGGLPAFINGTFYMPNLIPSTLLPLATIPVSINCVKNLEADKKSLSDVSILMTDTSSLSAVL